MSMSDLSDDQKSVVYAEVEQYLAILRGIKSDTIGGPSGIMLPPTLSSDAAVGQKRMATKSVQR